MKKQDLVFYVVIIVLIVLIKMVIENETILEFSSDSSDKEYAYYDNNDEYYNDYYNDYSNYFDNYLNNTPDYSSNNSSNEYDSNYLEEYKNTSEDDSEYYSNEIINDYFDNYSTNYTEDIFTDYNENIDAYPTNYYENIEDYPVDYNENIEDFYYSNLNSAQKDIYAKIKQSCEKFDKKVKLNKNEINDVYIAQNAVMQDNPEYYWLNSFIISTINNKVVQVEYEIPSNAKSDMQRIKQIADSIVANSGNDKVSQIKYFYDWIVENTEYKDTPNSQNLTSVFLDKQSVCAGYSKAFKYLCREAGIECVYVYGYTKNNLPHAWNMVRLNNNYYWVDVTWGDPVFAEVVDSIVNYNFLLVSDKDFLDDHIINTNIKMQNNSEIKLDIVFPSCTDDSLNYYRNKGCYFDSYDKSIINNYLNDLFSNGIYEKIELKFGNNNDFSNFLEDYFGRTKYIFDVVKSANRGYYGTINVSTQYIEEANYICINIEL